jgi:hypothetical protein
MAADPRLNSVHLEDCRRDDFRRARDVLLEARGERTACVEEQEYAAALANRSRTAIQKSSKGLPPHLGFAVVDRESVYPLKVGLNTIGRLPDNDVVLDDPYVSRRHCAILVHASEGCELHDVASKNGTFLNGQRISGPTPLSSGDEIQMCDRHLIFVHKGDIPKVHPDDHTQAD